MCQVRYVRHKLRGDSEEEMEVLSEGGIVPAERIIQQAGFKVSHTQPRGGKGRGGGGGASQSTAVAGRHHQ